MELKRNPFCGSVEMSDAVMPESLILLMLHLQDCLQQRGCRHQQNGEHALDSEESTDRRFASTPKGAYQKFCFSAITAHK